MIAKTIIGRSFKGCINYNVSKVENGLGEILAARGVRDYDKKAMIKDFVSRQTINTKLTRNVWHTALSFLDKLTSEQMLNIALKWIANMGLSQTQYVVIRHTDTAHHHVHIIANRIDDHGDTIADNNNWKRSEKICQKIVSDFQLTPVPDRRNERRINRDKLRGKDLLKSDINRLINDVINLSNDLDDFSARMKDQGFNCLIRYDDHQNVRGVSFERDGVTIKASDIHKSLSAKNLANRIGHKQKRNRLNQRIKI